MLVRDLAAPQAIIAEVYMYSIITAKGKKKWGGEKGGKMPILVYNTPIACPTYSGICNVYHIKYRKPSTGASCPITPCETGKMFARAGELREHRIASRRPSVAEPDTRVPLTRKRVRRAREDKDKKEQKENTG